MSEHCTCATSDICQVHDAIDNLNIEITRLTREREEARGFLRDILDEEHMADVPKEAIERFLNRGTANSAPVVACTCPTGYSPFCKVHGEPRVAATVTPVREGK